MIVLAMLLAGWLLAHSLEARVDPWDNDVERWFGAERTSNLNRVAAACTFLGDTLVGVVLAAVVAAAVSLWQRSIRPAIFFAVLLAGALGLYLSGVHLTPRDRPPVPILDLGLVPDHSFPSGHGRCRVRRHRTPARVGVFQLVALGATAAAGPDRRRSGQDVPRRPSPNRRSHQPRLRDGVGRGGDARAAPAIRVTLRHPAYGRHQGSRAEVTYPFKSRQGAHSDRERRGHGA